MLMDKSELVQNNHVLTVTPLQNNMDEVSHWENRPFSIKWSESRCDKPKDIKKSIRKKPKRVRTAYTTEQLRSLERIYNQTKYVTADRRREIANSLKIGDKSVKIWFQNRRMKEKRSSSESSDSSCETSGEGSPPPSSDTMENQAECFYSSGAYQNNVGLCGNTYEQPMQLYQTPDYIANGMEFYNDTNMYPTQYYPPNDNYAADYYNYYYQNPQQNQSAWTTENLDHASSCQFYC